MYATFVTFNILILLPLLAGGAAKKLGVAGQKDQPLPRITVILCPFVLAIVLAQIPCFSE